MKEEKLLKIINHYGVIPQLKHFQSEVFELSEAIIAKEIMYQSSDTTNLMDKLNLKHITEEIADVMVMLEQFKLYYGISSKDITNIFWKKVDRQLERIKNEQKN